MFERLLVATDFSDCANGALAVARRQFPAARRRLLYVEDSRLTNSAEDVAPDIEHYLQLWQDVQATLKPEETATRRIGLPAQEVLQEALDWNADLIVMGTHGRQGLARALFGSVAESVLRDAPVPVLVVRLAPVTTRSGARARAHAGGGSPVPARG